MATRPPTYQNNNIYIYQCIEEDHVRGYGLPSMETIQIGWMMYMDVTYLYLTNSSYRQGQQSPYVI